MSSQDSDNKFLRIFLQLSALLGGIYYAINIFAHIHGDSLFGFNIFALLISGIVIFIISIILGIILILKIKKNINPQFCSPLFNKWFLTAFIVISVLNIGLTSYLFGSKNNSSSEHTNAKTRIVIMLPLADVLKPAYQDGMRQMYGYAEFLTANNSQYTENFDFAPFDHTMSYERAKDIVEKEVQQGTKYFVCTMSKVGEDLSKNFETIIAGKYEGEKPILILTVTSSPNIVTKENSVYRFYIRSQEEGKTLANFGNDKKINSATYIVVNDAYGNGAIDEFRKNWKGELNDGIKVDYSSDTDKIAEQIKQNFAAIPESRRKAIFIAHYGNGIDNIIRALDKLKINGVILATSTLSIPDWQEPIKDLLNNRDWYTCVPDYKGTYDENNQKDVIKNFTTHTLKKLVQAINFTKYNPGSSFDSNWKKAEVYTYLDVEWDKNGDSKIPMKIAGKSDFKKLIIK